MNRIHLNAGGPCQCVYWTVLAHLSHSFIGIQRFRGSEAATWSTAACVSSHQGTVNGAADLQKQENLPERPQQSADGRPGVSAALVHSGHSEELE